MERTLSRFLLTAVLVLVSVAAVNGKGKDRSGVTAEQARSSVVGLLRQKSGRVFCFGSLIHPQYVLTAEECVEDRKNRVDVWPIEYINNNYTIKPGMQASTVKQVFMFGKDMVLMELDDPIMTKCPSATTTKIYPFDDNAMKGMVTGLKQTNLRIEDEPSKCIAKKQEFNPESDICTRFTENTELCGNDLGTPLWCGRDKTGYKLCGINMKEFDYNFDDGTYDCGTRLHVFAKFDEELITQIGKIIVSDMLCNDKDDPTVMYKFFGEVPEAPRFGSFNPDKEQDPNVNTDDPSCIDNDCGKIYRNRVIDYYTEEVHDDYVRHARYEITTVTGDQSYFFRFRGNDGPKPSNWFNSDKFLRSSYTTTTGFNFFPRRWELYAYIVESGPPEGDDSCSGALYSAVIKRNPHCGWGLEGMGTHVVAFNRTDQDADLTSPGDYDFVADSYTISLTCQGANTITEGVTRFEYD